MNRILLTLFLLSSGIISAQTQFWADDFESAAPTSGTRTSSSIAEGSGGPPHTRYFKRATLTPPSTLDINASYNTATIQGTRFWAVEDNDGVPTGASGGQPEEQSVTWGDINITGKIGLSFRGLFATGSTAGWDHGTVTTVTDYARVEYNINGAGWVNLIEFRPTNINATNGNLAVDTDLNGHGDGTVLTTSFSEFSVNIPGAGTSMQLRVTVLSNTLAEEFAFDNIRLLANAGLPVELSDFFSQCKAGRETVTWRSETERYVDYYGLERSDDGLQFDPLAQIDAFGTSDTPIDYAYTVTDPQQQQVYYRLRMVDTDGSFEFSKTIAAKDCSLSDGLLESFSLQDGRLACTFHAPQLTYELLTTDGRSVTGSVATNDALQHSSDVSAETGIYLLRIRDDRHSVQEVYRIFVP